MFKIVNEGSSFTIVNERLEKRSFLKKFTLLNVVFHEVKTVFLKLLNDNYTGSSLMVVYETTTFTKTF